MDISKLAAIAAELEEHGIDCQVDYPEVITGGHDDVWFTAGFANGGAGVDIYEEPEMSTYIGGANSDYMLDDDPRVVAAFMVGVIRTMQA